MTTRFVLLQFRDEIYDWRLLTLSLLQKNTVLDRCVFTFSPDCVLVPNDYLSSSLYLKMKASYPKIKSALLKHASPLITYRELAARVKRYPSLWIAFEAYFSFETVNYIYITEKLMMAIEAGLPFIVFGQHGTLDELKRRGYRSFSTHIDESYDLIKDPLDRINAAIHEILKLHRMRDDEWSRWIQSVQPICEHNRKHMQMLKESYLEALFDTH